MSADPSNVVYFPRVDVLPSNPEPVTIPKSGGTGSGEGGDMEPRLVKLETEMIGVKDTLNDLKGLSGKILWSGIGAAAALGLGLFAIYTQLNSQADDQYRDLRTHIDAKSDQANQRFEAVDAKLDTVKDNMHRIELNVQRIADAVAREPTSPSPKR